MYTYFYTTNHVYIDDEHEIEHNEILKGKRSYRQIQHMTIWENKPAKIKKCDTMNNSCSLEIKYH